MQQVDGEGVAVELRLTVWPGGEAGWHARVIAPDATELDFASPFELARYLAWTGHPAAKDEGGGLR